MTGQKQGAGAVDDCRGGRRCPPLRNYKKKSHSEGVVFLFVIALRFCCSHPRISQGRGSVRGKPLRVSPLTFSHPPAGDHFCTAKVPHQKRRGTRTCVSSFLVRAMGLEPTRPYGHKHLKLACLPIPARSQTEYPFIIAKRHRLSRGADEFPLSARAAPFLRSRGSCRWPPPAPGAASAAPARPPTPR